MTKPAHFAFISLFTALLSLRAPGQTTENSPSTKWPVQSLSIQWIGFTYHPGGGDYPEVYPLKIDKQGYGVFELGLALNYDYQFHDGFFLRSALAYYKDCAFVDAGFVHLGVRGIIWSNDRHSINAGLGPTFLVREDWHKFREYVWDDFYGERVSGKWQYRFIWYGLQFEYLYRINDRLQLHYSLIPGVPAVLTSFVGVRCKM